MASMLRMWLLLATLSESELWKAYRASTGVIA
jgi:hypothetical protein